MALIRVCDKCFKHLDSNDYVEICYKKFNSLQFPVHSSITVTLCKECFEEEYGTGHLESMAEVHERNQAERWGRER